MQQEGVDVSGKHGPRSALRLHFSEWKPKKKIAKYPPEIYLASLHVPLSSFIDPFCVLKNLTNAAMDELLQHLSFKTQVQICAP